jgi:eukaryotic-like serine/threonine-protein kinase
MTLAAGDRLGAYEIAGVLGAGGMGVVYRAYDTMLRRPAAIKVLSRSSGDPGRELLREAQAASALSHPHICHVYQVGEIAGQPFIAMEFVEGRPLEDAIPPDGLPADTLLRYGIQLADALAHAHDHAIIHRDLKSGNVVLTPAGRVKVLDFGLAVRARADVEAITRSKQQVTGVGGLAGTLAYMAPELFRGEAADARSDIWALGVLLYEMASGRLPFAGQTGFELTAAILAGSAPALPARVPAAIRVVISRCLSPDPALRYQHAGEVRAAFETVLQLLGEATAVPEAPPAAPSHGRIARRRLLLTALPVLSVVLLAGAVGLRQWFREPDRAFQISEISGQRIVPLAGRPRDGTLSPDGRLIAYVSEDTSGRSQIWVASLIDGRPVQVTTGDAAAFTPRWSPRGEILFASAGSIWAVAPLGGPPRQIIARGRSPSVSADGDRLAFEGLGVADGNTHVWIANADGSGVRQVVTRSSLEAARPALSPDGARIAYLDYTEGPRGDVWVADVDGRRPRRLTFDAVEMGGLAWAPDGESIVFSSTRSGSLTLWSIAARGGEPEPVTSGAGEDDHPALSADGRTLLYTNVRTSWGLMIRDPAAGTDRQVAEARSRFVWPTSSPDGAQIAFFRPTREGTHLFVIRPDGTGLRQVTATPGQHNVLPQWSGDGRFLYHLQTRPDPSLRRVAAVGGESVTLAPSSVSEFPSVSPDGSRVVVRGDRTVVRELATGAEAPLSIPINEARWSRDGRLIAGTQTVTGEDGRSWNVVVCAAGDWACRVITAGHSPAWTADGTRLLFLRPAAPHRELWSITLDGENLTPHGSVGPFRLGEVWIDVSSRDEVLYSQLREGTPEVWVADVTWP